MPARKMSLFLPKNPLEVSERVLREKIQSADFLLSDEKCSHRLVGLRYDPSRMKGPEVAVICARHEMALAKQIALSLGKKMYVRPEFSAVLFREYYCGERLAPKDYAAAAKIYALFYRSKEGSSPRA